MDREPRTGAQLATPIEDTVEDVIRVKSSSNANQLAQAIAHSVYEKDIKPIRAIGAGAVNQAVKALAIARGYVAPPRARPYGEAGF